MRRSWGLVALIAILGGGAGCHEPGDYTLSPDRIAELLAFETANGSDSLPADGISTVELRARISAAADKRTLRFSTSAGTLIGGTEQQGARIVSANEQGVATITLRSSRQVETAVVRAEVAEDPRIRRELRIAFVAPDQDSVIRFDPLPPVAPADGATVTVVSVTVSASLPEGQRTVSFATTLGRFAPSSTGSTTSVAGADNHARADLISPPTIGIARIQASIAGFTREASVEYQPALPDLILVRTDKAVVQARPDDRVTVTGELHRTVGKVTDGVRATFEAREAGGSPIGTFRNETLASNGIVTVDWYPGATGYRGTVTISIKVDGSPANGQSSVEVVSPPASK